MAKIRVVEVKDVVEFSNLVKTRLKERVNLAVEEFGACSVEQEKPINLNQGNTINAVVVLFQNCTEISSRQFSVFWKRGLEIHSVKYADSGLAIGFMLTLNEMDLIHAEMWAKKENAKQGAFKRIFRGLEF